MAQPETTNAGPTRGTGTDETTATKSASIVPPRSDRMRHLGCPSGCPLDHHEDTCAANRPASSGTGSFCCLSMTMEQAAHASRYGITCEPGRCARVEIGRAS